MRILWKIDTACNIHFQCRIQCLNLRLIELGGWDSQGYCTISKCVLMVERSFRLTQHRQSTKR
jgi:hypothetical protein